MAIYYSNPSSPSQLYTNTGPAIWNAESPRADGIFLGQVRDNNGEPIYVGICRYWKNGSHTGYWTKKGKIRRHKQERVAITHWAVNVLVGL